MTNDEIDDLIDDATHAIAAVLQASGVLVSTDMLDQLNDAITPVVRAVTELPEK
jgi:hypothetical protein